MDINKYYGTYVRTAEVTQQDSSNLASHEAVVGSKVILVYGTDDKGKPTLSVISSARKASLGAFSPEVASKITELHASGMEVEAYLSAVAYSDSERIFWGEFGIIAYPESQKDIWQVFTTKIAQRIAGGAHPDLALTQKTYNIVMSHKGDWDMVRNKPYDKLERGGVYFKKRRTLSDSLISAAVEKKVGCTVAAIIFWVLLAAVIVFVVWYFWLR